MDNTTSYEFSILQYMGAEVTGDVAHFYYDDFAAEVIWRGPGRFTIELYAFRDDTDPDRYPTMGVGLAVSADQVADTVHTLAGPFLGNPAAIDRAVAMKIDRSLMFAA